MIPAFPTPPLLDEAGEISALSIRERAIWKNHWKSPQACAWALDEWRWPIIAEMCRVEARVEESSSAALIGQLHRYRDQLGLTPAGLKENGWKIGTQETQTTTATAATGPVRGVVSARDRVLKVAG